MPETPDFNQIARQLVADLPIIEHAPRIDTSVLTLAFLAEQLRWVWNARGAADLIKVDVELSAMMGGTAAGPYVKNLDLAIRTLDR
jgi:hypothetical protein